MPRNKSPRTILSKPQSMFYKPRGVCLKNLEVVSLRDDEFEAIKLHDFDQLPQLEAALSMNISQPTFGRILNTAYQKISKALFLGKAIEIQSPREEMLNHKNSHDTTNYADMICDVCGEFCLSSPQLKK